METKINFTVPKLKLREAQSNLKMAKIILEMHENGMRELKEDIENLEAIINNIDLLIELEEK